jgi:UDP-glucose 4-epimerase
MKILITGGAGFIGSHLAEQLIARGDEVAIIDNFATGRKDNIADSSVVYEGTIADRSGLRTIFETEKPEVVIHAAASYKDPNLWSEDVNTNCLGGVNVVQLSKEFGVRRIIYFQTSCAFGHSPKETPISVDCPLNPDTSSYAITKTTTEYFLKISGINYVSFRLANCVGRANLTGPIPTFYQRLSQGKKCFVTDTRRDFIDVLDLCKVVLRAVDGEGTKGAYHISTGRDYSIKEIYDTVINEMGIPYEEPELQPKGDDDTYTLLIDPSKTEKDFPGWKCVIPIQETIYRAVEWYKTHKIEQTYTHLRMSK